MSNKNISKTRLLLDLYFTFFKIGSMTFGGGYAMLPLLNAEVVEKKQWADEEQILDYYAIGQCTPGIIAVNTATFVGYNHAGILGGIIATLGFITPSIITILLIASVLDQVSHISEVKHAFAGVRIAVTALIFSTVFKLIKNNVNTILKVIIAILAFLATVMFDVSPIIISVAAAIVGILFLKEDNKNE